MLKKALASGIAVVAIVGLVSGPASARHKHYRHGQTTGMSNGGPTVSHGGGEGPSGGAAASGSAAGSGGSPGMSK